MGYFPMAASRDDPELMWFDPDYRGTFPIEDFHISRSLAKRLRRGGYDLRINHDFAQTMRNCAAREETWINAEIFALYTALHEAGFAHSVEIWVDEQMVGGLYGVAIGAAFFGESMFSTQTDASKIALAHLMAQLRAGGFQLCDTQFLTDHLATMGAVEISQASYKRRLARAIKVETRFPTQPAPL